MSLDFFGSGFNLNIDDDVQDVKSRTGCLLTLLLALVTLAYTFQKTEVLIQKSDTQIMVHFEEEYFPDTYKFGYEQGFNIAVGFSSYDNVNNDREYELRPQIGYLRFRAKTWGMHENGTAWAEQKVFDSHVCTREELGLEGDS